MESNNQSLLPDEQGFVPDDMKPTLPEQLPSADVSGESEDAEEISPSEDSLEADGSEGTDEDDQSDSAPARAAKEEPVHVVEIAMSHISHRLLEDHAEVTCKVGIFCPQNCNLTGLPVIVTCDNTGEEQLVPINNYNKVDCETDYFIVKTGSELGVYSWTASFACDAEGKLRQHSEVNHTLRFEYWPHTVSMAVWSLPMVYEEERDVTIKVGAVCTNACSLAGRDIKIIDPDNDSVVLATAPLGEELWPGTTALYWTDISFTVPAGVRVHTLSACIDGWSDPDIEEGQPGKEHSACTQAFHIPVIKQADYALDLTFSDCETGEPIEGAEAIVHPYKRISDASGHLVLPVDAGEITLKVFAEGYKDFTKEILLTNNYTMKAEMMKKPVYWPDE